MDAVFYVMAILGCGDGSAACEPVRVEPKIYRTAAECHANLATALTRHTDLSYPVVTANCRREGALMAQGAAKRPRG